MEQKAKFIESKSFLKYAKISPIIHIYHQLLSDSHNTEELTLKSSWKKELKDDVYFHELFVYLKVENVQY